MVNDYMVKIRWLYFLYKKNMDFDDACGKPGINCVDENNLFGVKFGYKLRNKPKDNKSIFKTSFLKIKRNQINQF